MAELLTGLSAQQEFPRVDLTEDNADMLELLMANAELVGQSHQAIEQVSWVFKLGHATIMHGAPLIHDDDARLAAIDHGAATFEAMTCLMQGIAVVSDIQVVNNQAARLRKTTVTKLGNYMDESLDSFTTEMPRTVDVIRSSSRRFHGPLTNYAILGAAMSRRFDLDSADAAA